MPRGKKSESPEGEVAGPSFDFPALPGMIRLLRRPFDMGAPRYHFKSVLGVTNGGRTIKKVIAPTPVRDGAGWEEWLVQDNAGNRATIETGFRDPAFCYTPIYAEDQDPAAKFRAAVQSYISMLERGQDQLDARFQKLNKEAEALESEMQALMEGGLTEAENARLEALNKKEGELRNDRFDAEKAFRVCKARIKAQKDLLERLE